MYRTIVDQEAKDSDSLRKYKHKEVLKFAKLTTKRQHNHANNTYCEWTTLLIAANQDKAERLLDNYDDAYGKPKDDDDDDDDDMKRGDNFVFSPIDQIFAIGIEFQERYGTMMLSRD